MRIAGRDVNEYFDLQVVGDRVVVGNSYTQEVSEFTGAEAECLKAVLSGCELAVPSDLLQKLESMGAFVTNLMPEKCEGLVDCAVGDELVVYDTQSNTAHCISGKSVEVYARCDGKASVHEVAAAVGSANIEDVHVILTGFRQAGLVKSHYAPPGSISRRKILKAAAALPLVSSLLIPSAAAAASNCSVPPCDIYGSGRCLKTCPDFFGGCTNICVDIIYQGSTPIAAGQQCTTEANAGIVGPTLICDGARRATCCIPSGSPASICGSATSVQFCCTQVLAGSNCA